MLLEQTFIFFKLLSQSGDLALQSVGFGVKGASLERSRGTIAQEELGEDA